MSMRLALFLGLLAGNVSAGADPLQADELGLMKGTPPPMDKQVSRENFMNAPFNRWSLHHLRELQPSREVFRGDGPASMLERDPVDLEAFTVDLDDRVVSWERWLREVYTDAVIVLHDGKIVYEQYFGGMAPHEQHQLFSASKSLIGTLVLTLAAEGRLDLQRPVGELIPELRHSAFGDATVQQVLDMTTAVQFNEDYLDPRADIMRYGVVFNLWGSLPADYKGPRDIYEFLPTLKKQGEHGHAFHYVTPNTDVLGWLISRSTGLRVAEAFSRYFWQPLGMERDGYFWLDGHANEMAGGGLNATLRDAARFGQMILQGGRFNGRQIIPEAVAKRVLQAGDHDTFTRFYEDPWYETIGYAYHDQWWTFNNEHHAVSAIGVHGQFIYIDPVAAMVVVKFTSDPEPESERNEVDGPRVYHALARWLMQQK